MDDTAWSRFPSLNALRAFAVAARHLNFSRAAEDLHVTPSAISHQIRELEQQLGTALFAREPGNLMLTESGQTLLPGLQDGFRAIGKALSDIDHATSESISLSVPPSIATKWLVPRLPALPFAKGTVDVRLSSDMGIPDIVRSRVDLVIHYGDGRYPGLCSELLAANAAAPMCSPQLLRGASALRTPNDLARFTLLHDMGEEERGTTLYDWRVWLSRLGATGVDADRGLRFNTSADVINAAVAGAGVAIGKTALAVDDLKSRRLAMLFDTVIPEPLGYHLIYTEETIKRPAVAAFRAWLHEQFASAEAAG